VNIISNYLDMIRMKDKVSVSTNQFQICQHIMRF